jgi:hypothetical protein
MPALMLALIPDLPPRRRSEKTASPDAHGRKRSERGELHQAGYVPRVILSATQQNDRLRKAFAYTKW